MAEAKVPRPLGETLQGALFLNGIFGWFGHHSKPGEGHRLSIYEKTCYDKTVQKMADRLSCAVPNHPNGDRNFISIG